MAKSPSPRSIPTIAPVCSNGAISTSVQQTDTKYLPLGTWRTVAERMRPSIGRNGATDKPKFRKLYDAGKNLEVRTDALALIRFVTVALALEARVSDILSPFAPAKEVLEGRVKIAEARLKRSRIYLPNPPPALFSET